MSDEKKPQQGAIRFNPQDVGIVRLVSELATLRAQLEEAKTARLPPDSSTAQLVRELADTRAQLETAREEAGLLRSTGPGAADRWKRQAEAAQARVRVLEEALEAADHAMNYMGDILNEMDAVDEDDIAATERDFELVRAALAPPTAQLQSPVIGCAAPAEPKRMQLCCPGCSAWHVDKGEWATRPHHKHLCEHCGFVWDAGVVSVGVAPDEKPVGGGES